MNMAVLSLRNLLDRHTIYFSLIFLIQTFNVSALYSPLRGGMIFDVNINRQQGSQACYMSPSAMYAKLRYAHDDITYRIRSGEILVIPQPERYSSKDWLHNLLTLPNSSVLKRIRGVLTFNTLWSIAIFLIHKQTTFFSPGARCFSLLGSALGLLLVFRTNSAYNRFWEGRKIWESIMNSLRDFSRFAAIYSEVIGSDRFSCMLTLIAAFPIVMQIHLQGGRTKQVNRLTTILPIEDIEEMKKVKNKPLYLINKLAWEIRYIPDCPVFTSRERGNMLAYVDRMSSAVGAAERIIQTPIPLPYARHTSRFLTLFCLAAPIALIGELGLYVIPFTSFLTWSLFGILEIGMSIEEPFNKVLPLEVFSDTIQNDIDDIIQTNAANFACASKRAIMFRNR